MSATLAATPEQFQMPARASDGGGYFTHHGVWAPGVRLFRRLNFRAKSAVISVLFLIPIVVLSGVYLRQVNAVLGLTAREQAGIVYGKDVLSLLTLLQNQRLLTAMHGISDTPDAELSRVGEDVVRQYRRVVDLDRIYGGQLHTTELVEVLHANLEKAVPKPGANPLAVYKRQTLAIDTALALMDRVVDGSGLAVDPELDIKYLIQAGMTQLPKIANASLALGDLALIAGHGGNRTMTMSMMAPQRAIGLYLDAQVRQALDNVNVLHPEVAQLLAYAETQDGVSKLQDIATAVEGESWKADEPALLATRRALAERSAVLQTNILAQLDALVEERANGVRIERVTIVSLLATSLLLAAYMFISFSRVIQGGLGEVRRHLRAMTDGDLTTVPRPWGRDEAATLMAALREMQDALRGIVQQVRQSSEEIAGGSQQITNGAAELAHRSDDIASSLQRSAASMEEIGSTVRQSAEQAAHATDIGRVNVGAAERGGQVIKQVIATMQDIHASSSKIGEIIGVIDGIAFQTNILALNAAVEAARAGESGRGFAVVAAEVRSRAPRSAAAAREIKELVGSSVVKVGAGTGVVRRAGEVIDEIVDSSRKVNAILEDIAASTRDQAKGVTDVGSAVAEIDKATQHNSALVQETATAVGALQEQAQVLCQRVARFRLAGEAAYL
jgi:methyl-accepting chemotaxis protein